MLVPRPVQWQCGCECITYESDGDGSNDLKMVDEKTQSEKYTFLKPAWCCGPECCQKALDKVETSILTGETNRATYVQHVRKHQRCLAYATMRFSKVFFHTGEPKKPEVGLRVGAGLVSKSQRAMITDRFKHLTILGRCFNGDKVPDSIESRIKEQWHVLRTFILLKPQKRSMPDWQPSEAAMQVFIKDAYTSLVKEFDGLKAQAERSLSLPSFGGPTTITAEHAETLAKEALRSQKKVVEELITTSTWREEMAMDLGALTSGSRQAAKDIALKVQQVRFAIGVRRWELETWRLRALPTAPAIVYINLDPVMPLVFTEHEDGNVSNSVSNPISIDP